jgi:hypothetical protein
MSSNQSARRALLARERFLNLALDKPWTYDGDECDEELWAELLDVERQLGHVSSWPHTVAS